MFAYCSSLFHQYFKGHYCNNDEENNKSFSPTDPKLISSLIKAINWKFASHFFAAVTVSTLLGRLYTRFLSIAVRIWLHSATRALLRSGTDVRSGSHYHCNSSQRYWTACHLSSSTAPQPDAGGLYTPLAKAWSQAHVWLPQISPFYQQFFTTKLIQDVCTQLNTCS